MARTARVLGLTLASALTAAALSVTGPTASAGAALVPDTPREQYLLDSAHHGIAMNPAGTKLCVAGTMSDYATVVDRNSFQRGPLLKGGLKPYWVTPSADGRSCYISWSGSDKVSRISYATGRITRSVKVGDHPQRIRNGFLAEGYLRRLR